MEKIHFAQIWNVLKQQLINQDFMFSDNMKDRTTHN